MRDMEYEEIRARLSFAPAVDRTMISRRTILKALAAGVGMAAIPSWLFEDARAALTPTDTGGTLIVIQLGGGNDGLNTVVPLDNGSYYDLRGDLAIQPAEALPLTAGIALHPSLKNLQARFAAGKVAVVQGVGYGDPDMSHFQSMATWMAGWGPGGAPRSGWLGRYFDGLQSDTLNGVTVGTSVPLHLQGAQYAATAIPDDRNGIFGVISPDADPTDLSDTRLFDGVRKLGSATRSMGDKYNVHAAKMTESMTLAPGIASCYADKPTDSEQFAAHMTLCANLINANIGIKVLGVELGSFDTHSGQDWQHTDLLTKLDDGIAAFYAAVAPEQSARTAIMTFSEFGRRPEANGGGTDHGAASPLFVVGDGVKGGIVGQQPSLTDLDENGNMKAAVPFHAVYGTVLDKWLGADSKAILGQQFETLPLFA